MKEKGMACQVDTANNECSEEKGVGFIYIEVTIVCENKWKSSKIVHGELKHKFFFTILSNKDSGFKIYLIVCWCRIDV